MGRTIYHYDAEDIDFKDPVHSFLMGMVILSVLTMDPEKGKEELAVKKTIAIILNAATDQGISIAKSEVPAAFRQSFEPRDQQG